MKWLCYKAGPVEHWLGDAVTQFINGFISGLGGGSIVGAGVGLTSAGTSLGEGMSAMNQVFLSLVSLVLSATGNGLKRVIVWHDNNEFPNPFKNGTPPTPPVPPTAP